MEYKIDEAAARRAKEMNSFSDYKPGSATAEYEHAVKEAEQLVQRQKNSTSDFYHEKLDGLLESYKRRLCDWYNSYYRNEAACPSIMISGGSNFPVRKKERQNARRDTLYAEYNDIQHILDRIRSIGTGPIDFADPHAREMLVERVESLQRELDFDKRMNAYFRKNGTMKGFPGMSEETAGKIDAEVAAAYSWAKKPVPDYELASMRGKIKRAQERLAEYDKQHAASASDTAFPGGKIIRNVAENRLQIVFDDIPSAEVREALKENAFRWSPRNKAWQRQLTDNAERAARRALGIQ